MRQYDPFRRQWTGRASYVTDLWGDPWEVRRERPTPYGWPLVFGLPTYGRLAGKGSGTPSLVVTPPLANLLALHRRHWRVTVLPTLPVDRTVLQRVRRQLGYDSYSDHMEWYMARIEDLATMTCREFARAHGVSNDTVTAWRRRVIGGPDREYGDAWYLEPEHVARLASDTLPLAAIADYYARSVATIWQLRYRLRTNHGIPIADRRPGRYAPVDD